MSPKEQANELVNKYIELLSIHIFNGVFDIAKHCALIAVDEIIQQLTPIEKAPNNKSAFQYWNEVKQEIELL